MRNPKPQFAERFFVATERDRTSKKTGVLALARAVRPASLAVSARLSMFVATRNRVNAVPEVAELKKTGAVSSRFGVQVLPRPIKAKRRSSKPNTGARGAGFGLLSCGTTQRTMRAGRVLSCARSNPSIERTCPGKPGHASHLKR